MIFRYGINCGKCESRDLNSLKENCKDYMKERENNRSWKKICVFFKWII